MSTVKRYLFSALGGAVVGLGVGLSVSTGLGADALGVLWEGLSGKLGITVGQASLLVTAVCLSLVFFISRKELGLSTIVNPVVTSFFTDLVIQKLQLDGHLSLQVFCLVLGISLIGIGSGIASSAETGKEGYVALSFALNDRMGMDLARVRAVLDACCFAIGMFLGGKFLPGPILGVVLIGPLLKASTQFCQKKFRFSSEGFEKSET